MNNNTKSQSEAITILRDALIKARTALGHPDNIAEIDAALAAAERAAIQPAGVKLNAFVGADTKEWHITIQHPFGTSWVRMSDPRDIKLAKLLSAAPIPPAKD